MTTLTIVEYHYVRPLARTRFPSIKGLELALFEEQLDYIQHHYTVVTTEAVIDALDGKYKLPPYAALLTFDDGLLDHYTYVFPRLVERGLSGAFFPTAESAIERQMLDVHKIHFILASGAELGELINYIDLACVERADEFGLLSVSDYRRNYWINRRYDTAPVSYAKNMLQYALPSLLRRELTSELFARHVSANETAFAEELYMSVEQLRLMVSSGMHVGSHGSTHQLLGKMGRSEQELDILGSLRLLSSVGMDPAHYTICYPCNDYNADTIEIVSAVGFRAAFKEGKALANVVSSERFALTRLDTNDLPKQGNATISEWTIRAGLD